MLEELTERIEGADYTGVLPALGEIEGCRVTFDGDDFRFWKWGDEYFCASPHRVAAALRSLSDKEG